MKLRFSLRNGLIAIGILGVCLGMLGRLWRYDPELALRLMAWIAVVPNIVALLLIVRYHNQRFRNPSTKFPFSVTILLATGLGLSQLVGFSGARGQQSKMQWLPTSHLVGRRIEENIGDPFAWKELERRVFNNKVTKDELAPAFEKLVGYWNAEAKRDDSKTAMWPFPTGPNDILHQAASRNLISDELLSQIADLQFGEPVLKNGVRLRESTSSVDLRSVIEYRKRKLRTRFWSPWVLVWHVEAATFDDRPLSITKKHKHSPGQVSVDTTRGDHELTLHLACGYVSREDLANTQLNAMHGSFFDGGHAERRLWPKTRETWNVKLKVPVNVLGKNEAMVSLVTDQALDPTSKLRFARLSEMRIADNPQGPYRPTIEAYMILEDALELPIAMSYDVFLLNAEERIPVGSYFAHKTKGDVIVGREPSDLEYPLDRTAFESVTLQFVPNPKHVEKYTDVTEIWGKPFIMKNLQPWKSGPIYMDANSR